MRIGLDLRMLGGGAGISRYLQELSLQILKSDRRNQYVLIFRQITPQIDQLYRPFGHEMIATGIAHYSLMEQLYFPFILLKQKLDLMHFPHFNVPILYRKPFVVTIHDLTHTKYPGRKKARMIHRFAYNLILVNAIKSAAKIITVSNSTKTEVIEYFGPKLNHKIEVIYEGVAEGYEMFDKHAAFTHVVNNFQISKHFLLYVGVWRRYKNLPNLAKAFDRLAEKLDYELVLVGETDPFYPEIKQQVLSIKNKDRIKILGRVSDQDLKMLYNAADLLVLPSFYEGFGLTPLEAAACGTTVACSDIPTLREVMGSAAEYFDPSNVDNMTDVLSRILENPTKAEELANLGLARTKHFSWKQAGISTINLYESLNR